jgi:hypothetical protein
MAERNLSHFWKPAQRYRLIERQVLISTWCRLYDRNVEGFRALAYEILTWRNARAAHAGLWVNGLWGGSGRPAVLVRERAGLPDQRGFWLSGTMADDGFAGSLA